MSGSHSTLIARFFLAKQGFRLQFFISLATEVRAKTKQDKRHASKKLVCLYYYYFFFFFF